MTFFEKNKSLCTRNNSLLEIKWATCLKILIVESYKTEMSNKNTTQTTQKTKT
jgi:hypothetical protein